MVPWHFWLPVPQIMETFCIVEVWVAYPAAALYERNTVGRQTLSLLYACGPILPVIATPATHGPPFCQCPIGDWASHTAATTHCGHCTSWDCPHNVTRLHSFWQPYGPGPCTCCPSVSHTPIRWPFANPFFLCGNHPTATAAVILWAIGCPFRVDA